MGHQRSRTNQTTVFDGIEALSTKLDHEVPVLLLLDGYLTHIIPDVTDCPRSREILIIQLILHSPHLSQPLNLYAFERFKLVQKKERKVTQMKGKTFKNISCDFDIFENNDNTHGWMKPDSAFERSRTVG
jgi:hypothetical protein